MTIAINGISRISYSRIGYIDYSGWIPFLIVGIHDRLARRGCGKVAHKHVTKLYGYM